MHHQLSTATVLRGPDQAHDLIAAFDRFIERLRYQKGDFPWLVVPEYDELGRPHLHCLTGKQIEPHVLRDQWIEPLHTNKYRFQGSIELKETDDIRHHATYLSKGFELPDSQRPTTRRYRKSRHEMPQPFVFVSVTRADLDVLGSQIEEHTQQPIQVWNSDGGMCVQIGKWSHKPEHVSSLEALLNSYKPI